MSRCYDEGFKDLILINHMGLIYKLSSPDGKSYIGQTIQPLWKRMNGHLYGNGYCRLLKEAINNHGFESFKKEIIWKGDNEIMSQKEKYFIKYFNTMFPNGYNLSSGGGRGEHRSENTKKLMISSQRDNIKHKNNGLLGYIYENISKVDGRVTSWTVKNNNCGCLGNFKSREEALNFQNEYTQDPDKYINSYSKKRVPNGKGGIYYRKDRDKWQVTPNVNGKNICLGSYDSRKQAEEVLKYFRMGIPF